MFHLFGFLWLLARLVVVVGIPVAVVTRFAIGAARFAWMPPAAKRNYPSAIWARWRWRWLCRSLNLAWVDEHRRAVKPIPMGTSVTVRRHASRRTKLRYPRAHFRADAFGLVATVKTIPRVGRPELEKAAADHLPNAWRCVRVQVSQPKAGRLIVRGLKRDPLTLPLSMDDAPAGVYGGGHSEEIPQFADLRKRRSGGNNVPASRLRGNVSFNNLAHLRLYIGLDEWGNHRWLPLPGVTGVTVAGLPGMGKSSLINSWLCQLAGLPVQFCIIDLKGGSDFSDWEQRSWLYTGDDLADAAAALEDVHSLMRHRLSLAGQGGPKNRWHVGPTEDWPLVVTIIDECHGAFDEQAVKGQKEAEKQVRTCRALAAQLVKKGRAPLFLNIFVTQRQTFDSIPTAVRDNCGLGLSFAVKTRDAAVAALGEGIKEAPSYCPTTLQDRAYVGVATASLRTGQDNFVRIRVPEVTEAAAAARAVETAAKRRALGSTPAPAEVTGSPAPAALSAS